MSPSAADTDRIVDERPLKRARKGSTISEQARSPQAPYAAPSQVDHIFISEENLASKKSGKKNPLSCAECRRLKLKCDRTFPCGSCKKRGVSDICPEGVLVSGKGTRFILANTEQLHEKINDMSSHIRRLEEALERTSSGSHPLLQPEMLNVKSTMELYKMTQPKAETPSSTSSGRNHEHTPPTDHQNGHASPSDKIMVKHEPAEVEAEVQRLAYAFPIADARSSPESNLRLREYLQNKLPPQSEANHLWAQVQENALWQYNPHNEEVFFSNLAHHCYESPTQDLSTRRLALLFMILAVGCLVDLDKRGPESPEAEQYHVLGRAALSEVSVLEDTTVETILALFYEIWFLLVFSDNKKGNGHAWALMGLTAKLAQSIGLHRNGIKSKVIPEEVERRRSVYWELLYLDARLSLSLGRPPSLCSKYMDVKRPTYSVTYHDHGESPHYYQEWKHSCYVDCLAPVLDAISQPGLEYRTVIDLDRRIRDFHIPTPLQNRNPPSKTMLLQKASLTIALETVLLQLHRSYFIRALSHPEEPFNRRHRHAPSVVAIFLSAARMIATVQDLYHREPKLTCRILGYWSNAFSAAIALCLLASRAPFTCVTPAILQELERARILFNAAADACPRAKQMIPMLEAMIAKANHIFRSWYSGQEVPTMVFRHTDDIADADFSGLGTPPYVPPPSSPIPSDPFMLTHSDLRRCISEAHERAKVMLPMRKPCQCSAQAQQVAACPPSHSWAPPPPVETNTPVLPSLYPGTHNPLGFTAPSPTSATRNLGHSDNINFELGALHPNSEQTWMAWF